jgi:hypothetical protein
MPDQYRGWIEGRHVRIYAPGEATYPSSPEVAEIASLMAFLYYVPSVSTRGPASRAPLGVQLQLEEVDEDWCQVIVPSGANLWVARGDVEIRPAGYRHEWTGAEALVATAKRFLGVPYHWGGCTAWGIDCSGFVQLVYRLHGVQLLRDANIQITQPELAHIEHKDLQAGDLIFFGETRITHVGLCISDEAFIHATVHERPVVQISRLDDLHWVKLFQGGRRP